MGSQFLESVLADRNYTGAGSFTRFDGTLRSVHVDTEPKVIRKLLNSELGKCIIRRESAISGKRGCGSNWGCGFHDCNVLDKTLEVVRREVEGCDYYSGCVLFHSLSGGTGSGLTSRLVERIRDEYPLHHIMSIAIAPHWTGESPLQDYNTALCVHHLQSNVDAVIVFNNDTVLQTLDVGSNGSSVHELNTVIASNLCGCFLPVESKVAFGIEPWELFRSCCPIPELKFVNVYQKISRNLHASWYETSKLLCKQAASSCSGHKPRTISSLAVARGHTGPTFIHDLERVRLQLNTYLQHVHWNPFPLDFWVEPYRKQERSTKSLTVASNSNVMARYLSRVLEVAEGKFSSKAYLHWYFQYGCEENDFEQAFDCLRNIVNNYEHFTM